MQHASESARSSSAPPTPPTAGPDLPPLGRARAALLTVWAVSVSLLYLACRELGLSLVP